MPTVSVLMSVYNDEKYLRAAIESILNQTFTEFEFVIINDCSTDSSLDIIKSYIDNRIRLINNDQNLGLTKSLNLGLNAAVGKYIARLDADDLALPSRLEKQFNFLENNSDIALVGGWAEYIDEKDQPIELGKRPTSFAEIKFGLIYQNPLIHSTIFFRKDKIMEIGGYNEDYPYCQDYELYSRLVDKYKIVNLPEILIRYRVHDQQISLDKNSYDQRVKIVKAIMLSNINKYLALSPEKFEAYLANQLNLEKDIYKAFLAKENLTREEKLAIDQVYKNRENVYRQNHLKKLSFLRPVVRLYRFLKTKIKRYIYA